MAAIAAAATTLLWNQKSGGLITALFALRDVTSADTIDLATVGGMDFKKVSVAAFFGQDQKTAVAGSISANTTVTMTSASMSKDGVLLLAQGV